MPFATPVVIGNWKMNGLRPDAVTRVKTLLDRLESSAGRWTLGICPPATLLTVLEEVIANQAILLGGQDCSSEAEGAHTGDISADMLKDAGCRLVIVGHSERRHDHGESDQVVRAKAAAALTAGLTAIVCIGETEEEWSAGRTLEVLDGQLEGSLPPAITPDALILAYEPVWAIGTGRTPSVEDIGRTHAHLRERLDQVGGGRGVRILYGGSVKAANAGEILAVRHVDGALVGGASLDADEFWAIFRAGRSASS